MGEDKKFVGQPVLSQILDVIPGFLAGRTNRKSFATMISVVLLHLMTYVELLEFIRDTNKAWEKAHNASLAFAT